MTGKEFDKQCELNTKLRMAANEGKNWVTISALDEVLKRSANKIATEYGCKEENVYDCLLHQLFDTDLFDGIENKVKDHIGAQL